MNFVGATRKTRVMKVFSAVLVWVLVFTAYAAAQGVQADAALDARIRVHRQTELKLIVLDHADGGAQGATIDIEQEAHAFRVGFRLPADGPPLPAGFDAEAPGWRAFNAVSLARRTGWRDLQPAGPGDFAGRRVRAALTEAAREGLAARWGPLVPDSVVDLPEWAVPLRGDDLRRVLAAYLDRVVGIYGQAVTGIDLPGQPADGRLGFGLVRLLQQQADALAPGTPLNLTFGAGLVGPEASPARRAAESAAQQFVGHHGLTLGARLGPAAADVLDPALARWRGLSRPAVIEPLAVAEDPALGSGENLRQVLRLLFAEPWVAGIYFGDTAAATAGDPAAALFDDFGSPTAAGAVLDELFTQTWWTRAQVSAGPRGRASVRVFYGRHRVSVTLPDGSRFSTVLWVGPDDAGPRTVVLQPVSEVGLIDQSVEVDTATP